MLSQLPTLSTLFLLTASALATALPPTTSPDSLTSLEARSPDPQSDSSTDSYSKPAATWSGPMAACLWMTNSNQRPQSRSFVQAPNGTIHEWIKDEADPFTPSLKETPWRGPSWVTNATAKVGSAFSVHVLNVGPRQRVSFQRLFFSPS